MRAQIEPDYETARKRYDGILEKILAYTDYCDEHGDESGEKYRELENELRAITGKDMSKFDLWEWWEGMRAVGVVRVLGAMGGDENKRVSL